MLNLICFQTTHPYRRNYHAVRAAYHRRKALTILSEFWYGEQRIANALYTRFSKEDDAFVLGTEFVDGKGFDYRQKSAVQFLADFSEKLNSAGFIGATWQTEPALLVTTSNIKIANGRPVIVDLESAVPAIHPLYPSYLLDGFRLKNLPLLDDVDYRKLHPFLIQNYKSLRDRVGQAKAEQVIAHAELLYYHEAMWKLGETALLRHTFQIILKTMSGVKQLKSHLMRIGNAFAARHVEYWLHLGIITQEEASQLRGNVPGTLGQMAKDALFFSPIRKFRSLDFITEEEANRLQRLGHSAKVQLKDAVGLLATSAISLLTPSISLASIGAFLATHNYWALTGLAVSPALRTAYNAAAFAVTELASRRKSRQKGHWPIIFTFGALPLPLAGTLGYAASVLMDNKHTWELYKLRGRALLADFVKLVPFYGNYPSLFTQYLMKAYDFLFYRQKTRSS